MSCLELGVVSDLIDTLHLVDIHWPSQGLPQAEHQAFERILYVYKTENTSIRRLLDGHHMMALKLLIDGPGTSQRLLLEMPNVAN